MNIFKASYRIVRKNSKEIYKGFGFKHLSDATQYYVHPDNRSFKGTTTLCQPIGEAVVLFAKLLASFGKDMAKRLEADFKEDENIQYYYMDDINRVGKEEHYINTDGVECSHYYLYEVDKGWVEDSCEITDHQMGYDPTEDDFYKFGNTEIMASLHKITAQEAVELLKKGIN